MAVTAMPVLSLSHHSQFPTKCASLLVGGVLLYFANTDHLDYTNAAWGTVVSIQTWVDSDGDENATIVRP